MTCLSYPQSPWWSAHRGFDANWRRIAPLGTESHARSNGAMRGRIFMQDSTAAIQAALSGRWRYQ